MMNDRFLPVLLLCLGITCTGAAHAQLRIGNKAPSLGGFGSTVSTPSAVNQPSNAPIRNADYIVAVVNSEPITFQEVASLRRRIADQLTLQDVSELSNKVLEQAILERIQVQHAKETGIRVDEGMIDQAESNVARQNQLSLAQFRTKLSEEGISPASFREGLRTSLVINQLRDREGRSKERITDSQADAFIEERNSIAAKQPPLLNLAMILVRAPESASAQQLQTLRQKAQAIAQLAQQGVDFVQLAQEHHADRAAAAQGGEMGLRPESQYPSLFVEAVKGLRPGQTTSVLTSGAGFHIVKLLERRVAQTVPTQISQTKARHILLRLNAQMSEAQAMAELAGLVKRIRSGDVDFAEMAKQHSQDGSAEAGGDLGWANPGQFVPEFEQVMDQLEPGQISPPFASRFGVHVVQVQERRERALTQSERRQIASNALRERKNAEAYEQWLQDLRARAYVEFRDAPR
jgi:peptidyl-prolyl cis-trans isomerase SurA